MSSTFFSVCTGFLQCHFSLHIDSVVHNVITILDIHDLVGTGDLEYLCMNLSMHLL
jgi:hypothetical protein